MDTALVILEQWQQNDSNDSEGLSIPGSSTDGLILMMKKLAESTNPMDYQFDEMIYTFDEFTVTESL